jgi:hypothetical protein
LVLVALVVEKGEGREENWREGEQHGGKALAIAFALAAPKPMAEAGTLSLSLSFSSSKFVLTKEENKNQPLSTYPAPAAPPMIKLIIHYLGLITKTSFKFFFLSFQTLINSIL